MPVTDAPEVNYFLHLTLGMSMTGIALNMLHTVNNSFSLCSSPMPVSNLSVSKMRKVAWRGYSVAEPGLNMFINITFSWTFCLRLQSWTHSAPTTGGVSIPCVAQHGLATLTQNWNGPDSRVQGLTATETPGEMVQALEGGGAVAGSVVDELKCKFRYFRCVSLLEPWSRARSALGRRNKSSS